MIKLQPGKIPWKIWNFKELYWNCRIQPNPRVSREYVRACACVRLTFCYMAFSQKPLDQLTWEVEWKKFDVHFPINTRS